MPVTPVQWRFIGDANGNDTEDAMSPQVVQLANGNTVVAWTSADDTAPTNQNGTDIRAQIYDAFGKVIGGEFRLNISRTADDEEQPALSALAGGGFAVSYLDLEVIGGSPLNFNNDIVVDVFAADGTFQWGEVLADNENATGFSADLPDIASTGATSTLTVWYDVMGGDIISRIYDPMADSSLSPATIFSGTTDPDEGINDLAVTALQNNSYVVAFANRNPGNDTLQFQRVQADTGVNIGAAITVDTAPKVDDVSIATLTDGRFILAYTTDSSGGVDNNICARIYNADGTASSAVLNFASTVAGNQTSTAVAALANGEAVVFWFDGVTFDIHGQRLSATGANIGGEFNVRDFSGTTLSHISAVGLDDGRVMVTWQEETATDDVVSAIWDPRDAANSPDANGLQIGTILDDIFDIEPGASGAFGYDGNDRIEVDADEVQAAESFDGGLGTDVLVVEDGTAGIWDFTGQTVTGFEEIEFAEASANVTRTASFLAGQLSGVTRFDFDPASGSAETLQIFMDDTVNIDLSPIAVEAFGLVEDRIFLFGDDSNDTITGTTVGDTIEGGAGSDSLNGNAGNDTFIVENDGSSNVYNGGLGIDTLDFSIFTAGISVNLGSTSSSGSFVTGSTTTTFSSIANIIGSGQGDVLQGSGLVLAGAGDDVLQGRGDNSVNGGEGEDTLRIDDFDGSPNFDGGEDNDTFDTGLLAQVDVYAELNVGYRLGQTTPGAFDGALASVENYTGSAASDVVIGTNVSNNLKGGAGDDTLSGGGGDDTLDGGDGVDLLIFETATDDLLFNLGANFFGGSPGTGSDTILDIEGLRLGSGDDRAFGSAAQNDLFGGMGADTLSGLDGNDMLQGDAGDDALAGGNGDDTLVGGDNNDRLFGNNDDDSIEGGLGDDVINGGAGQDTVNGGDDDDNAVVGGSGNDLVLGGAGDDGVSGGNDNDTVIGGAGNDRVFGGQGQDSLQGGAQNDVLGGGTGEDLLEGGEGDDGLNGNTGNDSLDGGGGNDTLFGSDGDDRLDGGADDMAEDLLVGQGGFDTFVFAGDWGHDRISRYGELVQGGPRAFDEVIDMSGTAATGFADLEITQVGNSTLVTIIGDTANSIEILFQVGGITADDFVFL